MLEVVAALERRGFGDVARNVLEMGRQRVAGDYLQPSAIFTTNGTAGNGASQNGTNQFHVRSAINDVNDYAGPGTGYRVQEAGTRWAEIQNIPQAKPPHDFIDAQTGEPMQKLHELGPAKPGTRPEIIVGVGPAFGTTLTRTINETRPRGRVGRDPHGRRRRGADCAGGEGLPLLRLRRNWARRRRAEWRGHRHRPAVARDDGDPAARPGPAG